MLISLELIKIFSSNLNYIQYTCFLYNNKYKINVTYKQIFADHQHQNDNDGLNIKKSFGNILTLKAPITTAADDVHKYFSLFFKEIRLDVSIECSARQRIHMKNQALFSFEDKSKKLKCCLLQFLFGALRVNHILP